MSPKKLSCRRGFTLLELTVVLGIIALMAAAIMIFLGTATTASRNKDLVVEMQAIQNAVHTLYGGQHGYPIADNVLQNVAMSGLLPKKYVTGTGASATISDPFGINLNIIPGGAFPALNGYAPEWELWIGPTTQATCIYMMTKDFSTDAWVFQLYSNNYQWANPALPFTQAQAEADCDVAADNYLFYDYR